MYIALAAFAAEHQNGRYGLEILDRGLKQLPGSAALLFQRGLLLALEGDREGAHQGFEAAASADAAWSLPVLALGVLRLEAGDAAEAAGIFARVLKQFPEDKHARYLRALALNRTGDESTRAEQIALLERLAAEGGGARERTLLGQAYLASGRVREGVAQLERAVLADSKNATARYQLSLALRKLGRAPEANRHLARFQELKANAASPTQSELVQFLKIER